MSMKNILTLVINHHYYRNSRCTDFVIEADTLTAKFMKKNRVVVRYIGNTWKLFTDIDNDSLWIPTEFEDDTILLKFTLSSSDASFYKSLREDNNNDGINCMCNKKDEVAIEGISCTQKECKHWQQNKLLTGCMYWTICLNFKRSLFLTDNYLYKISFNVKDVYWKYIVFHSNEQENIEIIDTDSRTCFIQDQKVEYPNEKRALTFVSEKKMPLSEFDKHNFRLIYKKGSSEKNLIKRLPVATPSGVQFKDSEKKEFVSLIFINT